MRKLCFSPQIKKNDRIFSLAWNIVYWLLKSPCFELFGNGKYGIFWDKTLVERWYLLVTEIFLFWTFRRWKIRFFSVKKLMERWYLLVTEKFLFWTFLWWKIRPFLRHKFNGKMILTHYWKVLVLGYRKVLVLSFSLMGNAVFLFSQKNDVKVIFSWSFWAFHDIPGHAKYGFSCSGGCYVSL